MTEKNPSARVTGVQASPEAVPYAEPTPVLKPETLSNARLQVDTQPKSVVNSAPQAKTLGRYMILSELGRGGMGAVYLADDSVLKRKVALKIPQFEPEKAEQMQARFLREAQLAAQLSHPNICQIHDVGVIDGQYVMAMEYIEGKTLAAFAKPGKLLSERQVVSLVKKVALAVEAAHHQGMIHRDLKPGNIMLPKPTPTRKTIEPKVMDFGLAKSLDARTTELTKSGMIVGTPCYMSKEQWSGKDAQLGPPCDVYSLGVILYELLTGSLPYDVEDGEPATSWFVKLVTEPQRRLSERKPDIDAGLDAIVMKAIAKEPSDRFATMADFAGTLEAWLKGKPVTGQTLLGIQLGALADLKPTHAAKPNPGGGWRRIVTKPLVMWGGLGGFLCLFIFGVWLVIKRPDGSELRIEIPPGSDVSLEDTASGKQQENLAPRDADQDQSKLDQMPKFLTPFPEGAVYKGKWGNYDPGVTLARVESEMTIVVKRRTKDFVETEWTLHEWDGQWRYTGGITTDKNGHAVFTSTDATKLNGSHPNEGHTILVAEFNTEGNSFTGTANYTSGLRSEFEATLSNAEELGLKPDPIPLGSKWTGTLKSEVTGAQADPTPMSTTAEVIQRTASGFTIRTETTQPGHGIFVWEFSVVPEGDHFKVSDAILVQKTDAFTQDTGRILIGPSAVTLNGNELKLLINRPTRRGTTTQTFELTREE